MRLLIDFKVCRNSSVSTYCGPVAPLDCTAKVVCGDNPPSVADPTLFRMPFKSGLLPLGTIELLAVPFVPFEIV